MSVKDKLARYHEKRDFGRSPEPRGRDGGREGRAPRFVIQKHDARRLHYDLRLEIDGVLVSWAVPKGPSTDPNDKRLAIRTEDHPMEYGDFEGSIPEGEYGAGDVIVWDRGTWQDITRKDGEPVAAAEGLDRGHIAVWFEGEKIAGGYALNRMRVERGKEQWLLIKMDDDEADARRNPTSTEPDSVISGRSLKDVGKEAKDPKR